MLPGAVAVVAGREVPDLHRLRRRIERSMLGELPDEAVWKYLVEKCDLPPEDVPVIIEIAGGLPLALALIVGQQFKKGSGALGEMGPRTTASKRQATIRRIVEGLMATMPPQVADALCLGAIPHWFDEVLLDRLRGDDSDVTLLTTYMQRFRFMQQDAQGNFRYHDEVRDYLPAWWRQKRPRQYKVANRAALAYFTALAQVATPVDRPMYEREALYHLLIVDEPAGLQYLSEQFEDARRSYQLGMAEAVVAQAAQLKAVLTDVGQRWVEYFEARLNLLYHRSDSGEAIFKDLIRHAPDPLLQALARWSLGEIRLNQQRWSRAIRFYHASLAALQQERSLRYGARVMLSLGDAYCDLAENSGGIHVQDDSHTGTASRFLHTLQHLPFLIYEWLARRVSFLPIWYFGTNYQDWIIAYLLVEATRWYRRAERQLVNIGDSPGLAEARLALAELEHQLGRWSRAQRRYAMLLETAEIKGSLYRTAQVRLGQGRAFLDEGAIRKAEPMLVETLKTFRRFRDHASIGVTAALLGRVYATLGQPGEAASAYVESAHAFEAVEHYLAHTQVVGALEDLAQHSTLPDEQKQQADTVLTEAAERHYLTRFPDTLLRWFRRLAFFALPLTYVLTLIVVLASLVVLLVVEGDVRLSRIPTAPTLIEVVLPTLPALLSMWLYRLIYSLLGVAFVRFLGRHLIRIEQNQPSRLVADAIGLTRHDASTGLSRTMSWSGGSSLALVDYYQWRRPIRLISSTILTTASGMIMMIDALTVGYKHLQQDIMRRLGDRLDGARRRNLDFIILDGRWTIAVIAFSLAFALYSYTSTRKITVEIMSSGEKVTLYLASFLLPFVSMLLLVFPAVVLWRLSIHRRAVRRTLRYAPQTIPAWLLWLGATLCTVIAVLWIVILAQRSP